MATWSWFDLPDPKLIADTTFIVVCALDKTTSQSPINAILVDELGSAQENEQSADALDHAQHILDTKPPVPLGPTSNSPRAIRCNFHVWQCGTIRACCP